jgi:HAD superfamily hydrolase (TIGR01509 family)
MNMTKIPIRAFIFDNDGVVINSEPIIFEATARVFASHGIHLLREDVQEGIGAGSKYVENPRKKYGLLHVTPEELMIAREKEFRRLASDSLRPFPGFFSLMQRLKTKCIRTALASSAATDVIYHNLLLAGIDAQLFDTIVDSTRIKNKKPAPDIFLEAASNLELSPNECLVIEDSPPGIEAAHRAGMKVVAISTSLPRMFLSQSDYIVDSVEELSAIADTLIDRLSHESE